MANKLKSVFFLSVVSLLVFFPVAAFADAPASDIDQLVTESGKMDDVMDAAVPTAIASMTFAAGAKILKRVIYA